MCHDVFNMRTTLTIDDDLAGILRRKAHELDLPFKELVNTALRKGLTDNSTEMQLHVVVPPHDFGSPRAGLDFDRLKQLVDELAVEDYLRKATQDDSPGH